MGGKAQFPSKTEIASWYDGKAFITDWTTWHFPNWLKLLKPYRHRKLKVLEIGSWEGRSALFFLNFLPQSRLTCIDTFAGGEEHKKSAAESRRNAKLLRSIESRFDANTKAFATRIEKIRSQSIPALIDLGIKKRRFDFAYIDGGHRAAEVYADSALTWPMMARGGLVIFDDYRWDHMPDPLANPKPGIDAFLKSIEGQYRFVHRGYQVAVVKQ